jgi:anti-sigma-K factor RskA
MMEFPEDVELLLAAYALDAVEDHERAEVDRLLALDPRARAEMFEYREVATLLSFSGAEPPVGVWDRIVAEIDGSIPAPGPELAKVLPIRPRRRFVETVTGIGVAATIAAVVGVAAALIVRDRPVADPIAAAFQQASADRDSRTARLVSSDGRLSAEAVIDARGHGFLVADALPVLPRDRTYQLWGLVGEQVISLGVLGQRPSLEVFTVEGDVSLLVVTEEVTGGVPVSSADATIAGEVA